MAKPAKFLLQIGVTAVMNDLNLGIVYGFLWRLQRVPQQWCDSKSALWYITVDLEDLHGAHKILTNIIAHLTI